MDKINILSDNDGGDGIAKGREFIVEQNSKTSNNDDSYPILCCKSNSSRFGIDEKGGDLIEYK